jgi:peptidoglycan hydrolase-like protein with peptidoglycan-binding domain
MALITLGHEIGAATGFFGPRTRAMITAWQKQQNLPATGYLTAPQMAAVQEQAAQVAATREEAKRKAEEERRKVEAERRQAEVAEAALGLSEEQRRRVQVALMSLGHEIGAATGFFGPQTRAMIAAWQKKQGLPETSYLTASQLAALQEQVAQAAAAREEAKRKADEERRKVEAGRRQAEADEAALRLTEEQRRRVQVSLMALGHEIGAATGFFGPRTRATIAAWQKTQGLPETGFLTASQLALLQPSAPAAAKPDATQGKPDADRREPDGEPQAPEAVESALRLSEPQRKRVQVALSSLGHEIGSVTGYFGPRTRAMITAWQKKQGQPETGFLTASQLADLRQQAAPALARYDAEQRRLAEERRRETEQKRPANE